MVERLHNQEGRRGFTIVELLIVIVIIGILAAIVIVAFNGIQGRAKDTAIRSDLANIAKKLELARSNNGANYPFPLTTATDIRVNKNLYDTAENNMYYCFDSSTGKYAVSARDVAKVQYKVVDGKVSTHGSALYGASTCGLIGATWTGSTGNLGYDFTGGTGWSAWVQDTQ